MFIHLTYYTVVAVCISVFIFETTKSVLVKLIVVVYTKVVPIITWLVSLVVLHDAQTKIHKISKKQIFVQICGTQESVDVSKFYKIYFNISCFMCI
jgi:hypothetical protein